MSHPYPKWTITLDFWHIRYSVFVVHSIKLTVKKRSNWSNSKQADVVYDCFQEKKEEI